MASAPSLATAGHHPFSTFIYLRERRAAEGARGDEGGEAGAEHVADPEGEEVLVLFVFVLCFWVGGWGGRGCVCVWVCVHAAKKMGAGDPDPTTQDPTPVYLSVNIFELSSHAPTWSSATRFSSANFRPTLYVSMKAVFLGGGRGGGGYNCWSVSAHFIIYIWG